MESSNDDEESEQSQESGSAEGSQAASESGSEEAEEDEDEDSKEWDEYCYVCNDGGNMLCCESCTKVAHAACVNLKIAPKGAWHCEDCAAKLAQKKQASRAAATLANGRGAAKGSGKRDGGRPTRTSSRRAAGRR